MRSASEVGCFHHDVIDDHTTGDAVCAACGLCLGAVYLPSYKHYIHTQPEQNCEHSAVKAFIADVCEHAGIQSNLVDYSYWVYKTFLCQLSETRRVRNNNAVAAFALYESAIRHKVPRTSQEISYFSGISTSELWGIERNLRINISDAHPSEFVERYCSWLRMDYFPHQAHIKSIVCNLFGMRDVRSNCLVAAAIFLYSNEMKLKHSLISICETCGVSAANVMRVINTLDAKYVDKITLLCDK